jgi:GNAT superfamily N-acetyltransferase
LITALAGPDGWIDSLDILMAARGVGEGTAQGAGEGAAQDAGEGAARGVDRPNVPPALVSRPDLAGHPRAAFAAGLRARPQILGYPDPRRSAMIIVSEGIAGLTELSFELEPDHRGQGGGAELARDALSAIPDGQLALAAVAPGNAASLRALLAAGFSPLGSVQLFRRARHDPGAPD